LLDIKMLLHLVCFHPLIKDDEIEELFRKGRNFNNNDKEFLAKKEKYILHHTIEKYKQLNEKGKIEVSTSPMTHPILPLLYNTDIAQQTKTSFTIPKGLFSYPEDAKKQILEGIKVYENIFNRKPLGIWPSEGGLSNEILDLFSEYNIKWTATDEYLLFETLSKSPIEKQHYYIWEYKNGVSIFFRDHYISDLIGFTFQKMEEKKAAIHLFEYIHQLSKNRENQILTIILDGENPWDFYLNNGTYFLTTLYQLLDNSKTIKTTTFSEALNENISKFKLEKILPGSWIGLNFDNWIGKQSTNKAWEILKNARKTAEEKIGTLSEDKKKELMNYIMLAESSDWFWWYSLSVEKDIKEKFDILFRNNIKKIYEIVDLQPPEYLAFPVEQYIQKEIIPYITPIIDGKITHFYEWYNAIEIDVSSLWITFSPVNFLFKKIFYGYDEDNFYIRIDVPKKDEIEITISFINSLKNSFNIKYGISLPNVFFQWDEILEISIPRKEIITEGEKILSFTITIKKGIEKILIPATDYFNIFFGKKEESWII
ncbi:MAG: glycoside hydrolase family 57 protein, partial [Candidatus Omnitrophica bacterium]|nr:glycoside hydrolase family 57 protein [Candidatus Omnitrophota bacterium]